MFCTNRFFKTPIAKKDMLPNVGAQFMYNFHRSTTTVFESTLAVAVTTEVGHAICLTGAGR